MNVNFSKLLSTLKPTRTNIAKKSTPIELFLTWITPAIFVPMGRFVEDKDTSLSKKKELFVRDFTTYSIGASLYFAGRGIVKGLTKNNKSLTSKEKRLLGVAVGVGVYNLYAALGSIKTARFLGMNKASKNGNPNAKCYGSRSEFVMPNAKVNFDTCNGLSINKKYVKKFENESSNDAKKSLLFRSNIRSNTFRQFQTGYPRINLF